MARRVFAYSCRYCNKLYKSKYMAERHEKTCFSNPDSPNCLRCVHALPDVKNKYVGYKKALVCEIKQKKCTTIESVDCVFYTERKEG